MARREGPILRFALAFALLLPAVARAEDLEEGGSEDGLYLHDPETGIVPAPTRSLALAGLNPSLEGRFEATDRVLVTRSHGAPMGKESWGVV